MDIYWEEGELTKCLIRANQGITTKLRYRDGMIEITLKAGEERSLTQKDFSK